MSLEPKDEIKNLEVCPHGGIDYAELRALGLNPDEILDFSVCSNPFMPPPGVSKILKDIVINRYPDSGAAELRQRLSEKLGVPSDSILAGSGSIELIRLIALTYFSRGDTVLIIEPTFGEYETNCRIVGAQPVRQWLREEDGFTLQLEETLDLIRQYHPRGVFICNPNNPTGKYITPQEIERILSAIGDNILILDEAYFAFTEKYQTAVDLISRGNVVILRSMTKDYGLAGLRLGYAVASPVIIDSLRRVCPPWNINVIAQKMGVAVLADADYLEWSQRKIREAKRFLVDGLTQLGFPPLPSDTNYFLVKVDNAREFRAALLKYGILVRDCASFGLPQYVRIAPCAMPDCRKLIDAVRAIKDNGGVK